MCASANFFNVRIYTKVAMNTQEYEVIPYDSDSVYFHVVLISLLYRTQHVHKEFEISYIVEGTVDITIKGGSATLKKGDIFVINPFESHEIKAAGSAIILTVQVAYEFFKTCFSRIDTIVFGHHCIRDNLYKNTDKLIELLKDIGITWFERSEFCEIKCSSLIYELFYTLFKSVGYLPVKESELQWHLSKNSRLRRILNYIDTHSSEKLLLSDIATSEKLNLHYLSHFFKDSLGMSFQDYLALVRCEHARNLLITSELRLLDICANCGFSDPKYFMKSFRDRYEITPKEYRRRFRRTQDSQKSRALFTTQDLLSPEEALAILKPH